MIDKLVDNSVLAARVLRTKNVSELDIGLELIATHLIKHQSEILQSNQIDCLRAEKNNVIASMIDRLKLDEQRIDALAKSIYEIIKLKSPLEVVLEDRNLKSNINLTKISVPIGVIGMIYEARPNVTVDSAVLCLKSGNACILKGSSTALNTNRSIVGIIRRALIAANLPADAVQLIDDPRHESIDDLMKQVGKVDLIIPRGGANLINYVVQNSKVPVIETGAGVCHIFIEKSADYEMAKQIVMNAKIQRPAVCNSVETLLFDKNLPEDFVKTFLADLISANVEVRGTDELIRMNSNVVQANEVDWSTEYGDLIISCKFVDNLAHAVDHITQYGTKHSEAIITSNELIARDFLKEVDAACVYWNASTRFSDGGEFGFGAEIGISTQKIHVRGPVGLESLVSYKYILLGSGQIRS